MGMAKRRTPDPPPLEEKQFTAEEIDRGIAKLRRRQEEVRGLDPDQIRYDDQHVKNIEANITATIREVFGENSHESRHIGYYDIWHGGYNYLDEEHELQLKFAAGIPQAITMLDGLIGRLEEKRVDLGSDSKQRVQAAFKGLDLHPRIAQVATQLYLDGHFADAIFAASKALNNFVQERSGRFDLDGTNLMRTVFSRNAPILAFNNLSNQSDSDEQEGMMHLYEGAVLAIRNPRGHGFYEDSPERALEYIALLSMLAGRVDEAKKRQ